MFHNPLATAKVEPSADSPRDKKWGSANFGATAKLLLHIPEANEKIKLELADKASVILGRDDPKAEVRPDIDLTPYGAAKLGVSRVHILIRRVDNVLYITDLGSRNGTTINGRCIPPSVPQAISEGDRIGLGQMIIVGYFTP